MNFVINVESLRSEFFFFLILKEKKVRICCDVIYNKLITKNEIIIACRVDRVWFISSTFSIRYFLLF